MGNCNSQIASNGIQRSSETPSRVSSILILKRLYRMTRVCFGIHIVIHIRDRLHPEWIDLTTLQREV